MTLYHLLKLFQSDTNAILGKKTVVSEFYDEMVREQKVTLTSPLLSLSFSDSDSLNLLQRVVPQILWCMLDIQEERSIRLEYSSNQIT